MGMVQRREHLGLAFEPGKPLGILCQSSRKNLDRYFTIEVRIPRPIHFPHPTRADGREDLIGTEFGAHGKGHE